MTASRLPLLDPECTSWRRSPLRVRTPRLCQATGALIQPMISFHFLLRDLILTLLLPLTAVAARICPHR